MVGPTANTSRTKQLFWDLASTYGPGPLRPYGPGPFIILNNFKYVLEHIWLNKILSDYEWSRTIRWSWIITRGQNLFFSCPLSLVQSDFYHLLQYTYVSYNILWLCCLLAFSLLMSYFCNFLPMHCWSSSPHQVGLPWFFSFHFNRYQWTRPPNTRLHLVRICSATSVILGGKGRQKKILGGKKVKNIFTILCCKCQYGYLKLFWGQENILG